VERIRRHLTFSNVASLMALVFAMGGTGYAIASLPRNSVGAAQLKKDAVVSSKVKDGSLKRIDFKSGQLPRGSQGPRGPQGARGNQGLQGAQGDQGLPGADGQTGSDGKNGMDGRPGADGANGTAVAFARVDATGALIGGTDESKGITAPNVEHDAGPAAQNSTGVGVYCFGGLGFTPKSAVVTLDNADSLPNAPNLSGGALNFIPTVAVYRGEGLGHCDDAHQQVRVAIEQVNDTAAPTLADHGFIIWFE
jgi:Collagen triple helix repeat (20 copies)